MENCQIIVLCNQLTVFLYLKTRKVFYAAFVDGVVCSFDCRVKCIHWLLFQIWLQRWKLAYV